MNVFDGDLFAGVHYVLDLTPAANSGVVGLVFVDHLAMSDGSVPGDVFYDDPAALVTADDDWQDFCYTTL